MAALDTDLPIHHLMVIDKRTGHKQVSVYVACATQKRAAELFGTEVHYLAEMGGKGAGKTLSAFLNRHPEVVYTHSPKGREWFSTLDDFQDQAKHVHVPVNDPETYGDDTVHPAFGQVSLVRTSGASPLFQVDYDSGHSIRMQISTANLNRHGGHDRVHAKQSIVEIAMSEVQFARLVAGVGGSGVPCTLLHYRDPKTGEFLLPQLPEKHTVDTSIHKTEVEKRARKAMESITEAATLLRQVLQPGTIKKADLTRILELMETGTRQAAANLPYAVKVAHEQVEKATESGKAEIDAHIDFAMARLGERALGARLQQAIADGVDVGALGRGVALLLEDQTVDDGSSVA